MIFISISVPLLNYNVFIGCVSFSLAAFLVLLDFLLRFEREESNYTIVILIMNEINCGK